MWAGHETIVIHTGEMICYRNFTSTLCGKGFPCEQEEVERMNHCAVTNVDFGCFDLVNKGRERTRKIPGAVEEHKIYGYTK